MRNSLCASNFMDLRKRKRQPASTPGVHPPMTAPTNKPYLRGVSKCDRDHKMSEQAIGMGKEPAQEGER
jgi:hypothetical protein